jgi:cyclin-dependent kinase regulatory subunit CKS1
MRGAERTMLTCCVCSLFVHVLLAALLSTVPSFSFPLPPLPSTFIMSGEKKEIEYSDKYEDSQYEYRHVILTKDVAKLLPLVNKQPRLLSETEWRSLGVQQSRGWVHYEIHRPEPHVLLFRRPIGTDPLTGKVIAAPQTAQQQFAQNQPMMMAKKIAAK